MDWMNPKAWAKALLRRAALMLLNHELDSLALDAKAAIAKSGPGALVGLGDKAQERIIGGLNWLGAKVPFVKGFTDDWAKAVQDEGDKLEERAAKYVLDEGPVGVDHAVAAAKALLASRLGAA